MKIRCKDCFKVFTVSATWTKTGWRYKFGCHCEQVDMLSSIGFDETVKNIFELKKCWETVEEKKYF